MGRNKTSLYGKKQNQSFSGETKQIFMGKKQNQFYEITLMSQITNETNVNGNKYKVNIHWEQIKITFKRANI